MNSTRQADQPNSRKSYREENYQELIKSQPDLARLIAGMEPSADLTLVEAKTGQPVLLVKGISLHSRHDPEAEGLTLAEAFTTKHADQADRQIVLFGLGLGYHLRPLLAHFHRLIVVEPDPAVVRLALDLFDWRDILPRLDIVIDSSDLPSLLTERAFLLEHKPTARLHPLELARVKAICDGGSLKEQVRSSGDQWKIMVVSPVSGGSLPVARHVVRNLTRLGHQVIDVDYSGLDPYFQALKMDNIPRDRRDQLGRRLMSFISEYVTMLAEAEKPDLVLALAQAPLDIQTLTSLRAMGSTTAFWFVEDYRYLSYFRHIAAGYDYFFHIQGPALEAELSRLGVRHFASRPGPGSGIIPFGSASFC
ncbi:MAG: hypothetical protein HQK55_14765, partial [Deltaproteobacteria bacterium]|nr:hypothetical protein [Deltaproteobacteria bacterium]